MIFPISAVSAPPIRWPAAVGEIQAPPHITTPHQLEHGTRRGAGRERRGVALSQLPDDLRTPISDRAVFRLRARLLLRAYVSRLAQAHARRKHLQQPSFKVWRSEALGPGRGMARRVGGRGDEFFRFSVKSRPQPRILDAVWLPVRHFGYRLVSVLHRAAAPSPPQPANLPTPLWPPLRSQH